MKKTKKTTGVSVEVAFAQYYARHLKLPLGLLARWLSLNGANRDQNGRVRCLVLKKYTFGRRQVNAIARSEGSEVGPERDMENHGKTCIKT